MIKMKSLIATSIILALTACDGGDEEVGSSAQSVGTLEIVGSDFFAGAPLSVSLSDTDGVVDGTVTYSWVRNPDGTTVDLSTTSSYTLTEEDEGSIIQVTALYSTTSGLFKSENVLTTEIRPTLDVSAFAIKGPIDSAACEIFEVDENGAAGTTAQASSTSDATGAVTFTGVHFTGNGLISCAGGTYTDESTGNTLTAPTLRAVVDVVEDVVVLELDAEGNDNSVVAPDYIVSPLTELAVQAAGDDLTTAPEEAEIINTRFSIRFDATETFPTVIGVDSLGVDGAENADTYGTVLALISQLNADDTDKDLGTILSELATDISDGTFSTETQAAFEIAQTNLETTSAVSDVITSDLFIGIGAAVGYNNDPIPAVFEGTLSATINSSSTVPLTGEVTILDLNFEEDAIIPQTDIVLTYGTFSITAEGAWSYAVDTANETVAALELGNAVNELITITSIDGTTATIDIKVAALTQVAKISDLGGDTGEIRFSVDNLRQGKLSASFSKEVTLGSDGNIKDAYITLYGSSGSSSEALIDLRIQGNQINIDDAGVETSIAPRFLVRNTDNAAYTGGIITAPFVEQQFYDVDITWDLDATDQITVSIDGEVIGGGAFSTAAVVDSDFTSLDQWFIDGVKTVQFRLGDNDRTIPFGSYFVDNIAVYSDTAGTVSVFEDDFESYTEGETLATAGSLYSLAIYSEVIAFEAADTNEATPAVLLDLTGAIASDTATSTGQVNVFDQDAGEAFITASTLTGTYGTLAILEDGSWTYTLDTTNATIAALIVGERETETFTISSVDGTEADLVITISGTLIVDTGANNVAEIVDTLGDIFDTDGTTLLTSGDTGELRYKLDDALFAGRVELSIKRLDDNFGNGDAFIKLFNSTTKNDNAILNLRLKDDLFQVDSSSVDVSAATFALDTFMDVVITWEYPDTTDTSIPEVTVSIDGVSFTAAGSTDVEFSPATTATGGVTHLSVSFGDNSGAREATGIVTVDDLAIYSDTAGTTVVFADDFESYFDGDSLDTDNTASPYNSATSEATVLKIEGTTGGPGTEGNKFATIADTLTDDTGELRYKFDTAQTTGSVSFSFKKDITSRNTGGTINASSNGNASVVLTGSGSSSSDETIQIEIKNGKMNIDDSNDGSGSEIEFDTRFTQGDSSVTPVIDAEWIDVLIEWDATNKTFTEDADGNRDSGGVTLTVTINGIEIETLTSPKFNTEDIQHVMFLLGDKSNTNIGNFSVDDVIIIGADGTEILNDNFEAHVVGDVLGGPDDVYNSNSSEATVAEE